MVRRTGLGSEVMCVGKLRLQHWEEMYEVKHREHRCWVEVETLYSANLGGYSCLYEVLPSG